MLWSRIQPMYEQTQLLLTCPVDVSVFSRKQLFDIPYPLKTCLWILLVEQSCSYILSGRVLEYIHQKCVHVETCTHGHEFAHKR